MLGRLRWIFFAALCAGLLAGGVMSVAHQVAMVPLILQAEVYEDSAAPPTDHAPTDHAHTPSAMERALLTLIADLLAGIGFALLLSAGLALRGGAITVPMGMVWGVAGFAAFSLAPALGLPPELPGAEAAGLAARQIWWLATVAATAGGLALVAFGYRLVLAVAGVALIAGPHVIGAPHPLAHASMVPAELTRSFVIGAMATNLIFWVILGAACVFFMRRFARSAQEAS